MVEKETEGRKGREGYVVTERYGKKIEMRKIFSHHHRTRPRLNGVMNTHRLHQGTLLNSMIP